VLDQAAAVQALARGGMTADAVIRVVDASMERALRAVSVERGVDPRSLVLVAFGGAGPLHACALAEAVGMSAVIVPARAGVLSAVGLLTSPVRRDLVRSWPTPLDHAALADAGRRLAAEAGKLVGGNAVTTTAVDCRYAGQSHELTVASTAAFHEAHQQRNGFSRPDAPVEVVAIRATASVPSPFELSDLPAPERSSATGPVAIAEPDCTIWIPSRWTAEPGAAGSLVLKRDR
jgi:N-methylhydantoinase A/oxoprolinase/acetone carboxylase beta subunit